MRYILSYGGGINSSALFFYLIEQNIPLDLVIFADTGEDNKENYDSVEEMKKVCTNKEIEFVTVRSHYGNLYDYYFEKRIVMSMMRRDCTGKFKVAPIRKYLRSTYGKKEKFVMYIGIAYDEATRMKDSNVKYITNSYPFCNHKITRTGNIRIIKENNFTASKSGCKGCMFIKKKGWIRMLIENPKEFERHLKLEENNMRFPELTLNGSYSLRSLKDAYKNQNSLKKFVDLEPNCEVTGSCFL